MKRYLAAAAALVAVLLAALVLWVRAPHPAEVTEAAAPRAAVDGVEAAPARVPHRVDAGATAAKGEAGTSNVLPRPAPRAADAPAPVSIADEFTKARGPVDKRGGQHPRAGVEMERVSYAMETLEEDIEACLAEWRKSEPEAQAQVLLGFEIDSGGLQRSWVDADGGLPFGVRSCFSNAVYGLDWSHLVEQPAQLTNRFSLGDAGR